MALPKSVSVIARNRSDLRAVTRYKSLARSGEPYDVTVDSLGCLAKRYYVYLGF